jgi:hypothetical protein
MKFVIEHAFDGITCSEYETLYFDEPFSAALGDALQLGRALLHLECTPDRISRRVCCEPNRDPNSPAGQAFGTSRASFVEELEYDVRAHRGHWRTIPNLMPERVRNAGTLEIVATATGVKRIVRGEVKVTLFGFGGIVERMVVAEIEKSYAGAAKFTEAWLAKPRAPGT